MLEHLTITNFQSHKATAIDFDPRLTVLVGPSNNGKTAILRAIRWVLTNRPRGGSFIRNGADSATVCLDGVTREKGRKGGDGQYLVGGEALTALGGEVPQQIKDRFGMADINSSDQLAQHFLVLDAPGQIARVINEAVHLERAESAVKAADSETRSAKQDVKATQLSLEAAESALGALFYLQGVRCDLDAVIALEASLERSRGIVAAIRQVVGELAAVGKQIEAIRLPEGAAALVGVLLDRANKVKANRERFYTLEVLVHDTDAADRGIARLGNPAGDLLDLLVVEVMAVAQSKVGVVKGQIARILADLRQVDQALPKWPVRQVAEDAGKLMVTVEKWQAGVRAYNELYDLHEHLIGLRNDCKLVGRDLEKEHAIERNLLEELTECPTCGQELDETARKRVLS